MKEKNSAIIDFSLSEKAGINAVNQDYLIKHKLDSGQLYIVCDGIGLSEGADIASQLSALSIKEYFDNNLKEHNLKDCFSKAILYANTRLLEYVVSHHYLSGLGTSLLLVFIKKNLLYYTLIGDCKLYLIRNKQIEIITNPISGFDSADPKILGSPSLRPGNIHQIQIYQDDLLFLATNSVSNIFTRIELLKYASIFNFDNLKLNLLDFYRSKQTHKELSLIALKVNNGNRKPIELEDKYEKKKKLVIAIIIFCLSLALFIHTYLPVFYNGDNKSEQLQIQTDNSKELQAE